MNLNERVTTSPAAEYVRRDVILEGENCNTDLLLGGVPPSNVVCPASCS